MKIKKFVIAIVLVAIITLSMIGTANAVNPVLKENYVGTSDAKGTVPITNGTTKWTGKIKSEMVNPPVSINVIGYTTWTVRELCEATWAQNFILPGNFISGSSFTGTKQITKQYCGGMRFGRVLGIHDFDHTGVERWRPSNDSLHVQVP